MIECGCFGRPALSESLLENLKNQAYTPVFGNLSCVTCLAYVEHTLRCVSGNNGHEAACSAVHKYEYINMFTDFQDLGVFMVLRHHLHVFGWVAQCSN